MKKIFLWMLAAVLTCSLSASLISCSKDDNGKDDNTGGKTDGELAEYTIMYYAHGGGDLDPAVLDNIDDFYNGNAAAKSKVRVAVCYKFSDAKSLAENRSESYEKYKKFWDAWSNCTARFVVDPNVKSFSGDQAGDMYAYHSGSDNFTHPDSLTNFINWAKQAAPAKNYVLVISDHGGGYTPDDEIEQNTTRGIVYMDKADKSFGGTHFTLNSIVSAVNKSNTHLKAVYFDACVMNMCEYWYGMKDIADYLMLSTFNVPGDGGSYDVLTNALASQDIESALATHCKSAVQKWDKDDPKGLHDMSAIRTSDIEAFGKAVKNFTDVLVETYANGSAEAKEFIDIATKTAFKITVADPYYDLIDYVNDLNTYLPTEFGGVSKPLVDAFNKAAFCQESCVKLKNEKRQVEVSVLMGWEGKYDYISWNKKSNKVSWIKISNPDGTAIYYDGPLDLPDIDPDMKAEKTDPWGSTFAKTYEQTAWDKATGWSRWIKANKTRPNPMHESLIDGFDFDDPKEDNYGIK